MKVLRILILILVLIAVICFIAAGLLYFLIDPNKLKPILIEEVKRQTGYQLAIDGNLTWSFLPELGVKAAHMTLQAPGEPNIFADLSGVRIASTWGQIRHGLDNLKGDVYISDVRLANLHIENARIGLFWRDQVLTLMPIRANLYGGQLTGNAHGSAFALLPKWDWDVMFDRIQLQPLLEDVNGKNSKVKIDGLARIKFLGATAGKTRSQVLSNLQGSAQFTISNGVVKGVNLDYFVQTADALLNKQPVSPPPDPNQTEFENFTGSATILNGIASSNNLSLSSKALNVKGQGTINLIQQTIALDLQVKTQQTLKTQWEAPVEVSGNLANPDVRLDMREVEKMVIRKELDNVKTKVKEEIKTHVPGKAGELLQNLLGN